MVPARSHKVSRVSWYSGYCHVCPSFVYGAFTLCGRLSQNRSTRLFESIMRSEPLSARTQVWALPGSLAATSGIDVSFSSSGYLDVSVHRVPDVWLWIHHTTHEVCSCRFPHSDICGSMDICSSPQLFAAYHVFHRLLVPRHPPCALFCLTSFVSIALETLVLRFHAWLLFTNFVNRLVCYFSDVLIKIFILFKISFCMKFSRYNPDWIFISH